MSNARLNISAHYDISNDMFAASPRTPTDGDTACQVHQQRQPREAHSRPNREYWTTLFQEAQIMEGKVHDEFRCRDPTSSSP